MIILLVSTQSLVQLIGLMLQTIRSMAVEKRYRYIVDMCVPTYSRIIILLLSTATQNQYQKNQQKKKCSNALVTIEIHIKQF